VGFYKKIVKTTASDSLATPATPPRRCRDAQRRRRDAQRRRRDAAATPGDAAATPGDAAATPPGGPATPLRRRRDARRHLNHSQIVQSLPSDKIAG